MLKRLFVNRSAWRLWLEKNHNKANEIWLVIYKATTNKKSIKYAESVEEALCFGWIDSVLKRIDDEKYMQKFSPRKHQSNWSATNKARIAKLIKEGLMTEHGLKAVEIAKQNGSWNRLDSVDIRIETPKPLENALEKNDRAKKRYENLAPYRKKQFIWWIKSAKRDETKEKRIRETIRLLVADKNPGV